MSYTVIGGAGKPQFSLSWFSSVLCLPWVSSSSVLKKQHSNWLWYIPPWLTSAASHTFFTTLVNTHTHTVYDTYAKYCNHIDSIQMCADITKTLGCMFDRWQIQLRTDIQETHPQKIPKSKLLHACIITEKGQENSLTVFPFSTDFFADKITTHDQN